jgi:TPP-dependent pyruvate/acetoin dehydrogenase alpha subunit
MTMPLSRETGTPADELSVLAALYREIVRGRTLERRILALAENRTFRGIYHPGMGQEGVQVGACTQLRRSDYLLYAHRGITYLTAKGMDPVKILGDFRGLESGSTRGLGAGTVHCVDPGNGIVGQGGTLGSCFAISAGLALAARQRGTDDIAMAFFGDGASARGTFLESGITAVAWNLPVVWICENNGWAISAPIKDVQGTRTVAPRAEGLGMYTQVVDGQDVLAVRETVQRAIDHARAGRGPAFVEAMTHRVYGHYSGDVQHYRQAEEIAAAKERDPLVLAETRLRELGWDHAAFAAIAEAAEDEMRRADEQAARGARPGRDRILEGLYV